MNISELAKKWKVSEITARGLLADASPQVTDERYVLKQIVDALPTRRDWLDPDIEKAARALLSAPPAAETPLTDTFVQTVPDKCDRILWRGGYHHLPIAAAPQEAKPVAADFRREEAESLTVEELVEMMRRDAAGGGAVNVFVMDVAADMLERLAAAPQARSQKTDRDIYMICNSYESGFGHGAKKDGLDLSRTPHADPEQGEAYQIGYEAGERRSQEQAPAAVSPALAAYKDCWDIVQEVRDAIGAGAHAENKQHERSVVEPHLDAIQDEIDGMMTALQSQPQQVTK